MQSATAAAAEMRTATGNENIVVRELDLSRLRSVRQFASIILDEESRLDVLVNNAGTAGCVRCCTVLSSLWNSDNELNLKT